MVKLSSLVSFYIEEKYKDISEEEREWFKKNLERDILDEAIAQLTEEEVQRRKEQMRKEEEEERNRLKRNRFAEFLFEALFLAFLIGMFVNQCTALIENIRCGLGFGEIATSLVLIVLLLLGIVLFVLWQLGITTSKRSED